MDINSVGGCELGDILIADHVSRPFFFFFFFSFVHFIIIFFKYIYIYIYINLFDLDSLSMRPVGGSEMLKKHAKDIIRLSGRTRPPVF